MRVSIPNDDPTASPLPSPRSANDDKSASGSVNSYKSKMRPNGSGSDGSSSGQSDSRFSKVLAKNKSENSEMAAHVMNSTGKDFTKSATTLRQVLENPNTFKRFKEYAMSMHADEGLEFIEALAHATLEHDQIEAAKKLMQRFVLDQSTQQINLADNLRSDIIAKYESGKYATVTDLLDDGLFEVFDDLKKSDTFRYFVSHDAEAKLLSDDANILESFLVVGNHALIMHAVEHKNQDFKNLLRFCVSVSEFERESTQAGRKARGAKIATIYVEKGSHFEIDIPQIYRKALSLKKFSVLSDIRMEFLQVLAKEDAVMQVVRKSKAQIKSAAYNVFDENQAVARQSAEKEVNVEELMAILGNSKSKVAFINCVEASLTRGMVNKLKFCAGVRDYIVSPKTDKVAKYRKLMTMFVEAGGQYEVEMSAGFRTDLLAAKKFKEYDLVIVVGNEYAAELIMNAKVRSAIQEVVDESPVLNALTAATPTMGER